MYLLGFFSSGSLLDKLLAEAVPMAGVEDSLPRESMAKSSAVAEACMGGDAVADCCELGIAEVLVEWGRTGVSEVLVADSLSFYLSYCTVNLSYDCIQLAGTGRK